MIRRYDVAAAVDGTPGAVDEVSTADLIQALRERIPRGVLADITQRQAHFWFAGDRYWLDDESFGPVADIALLAYDEARGLYLKDG